MMKIVIFVIVKVKLGCGLTVEEIEHLREAAKEVFAEDFGISEIFEDKNKNILEAAKAYEDRRKKAEEDEKAAMHYGKGVI